MKKIIVLIILGSFLFSCRVTDNGMKRMNKFISEYRESFILSELPKYNYNPRTKFESYSDSAAYRIFIRPDNKILISVWPNPMNLDSNDRIQKFLIQYLNFLENNINDIEKAGITNIWLSKDKDNNLVLVGGNNIQYKIPNQTFEFDPIKYFRELEDSINKYGILEIKKHKTNIEIIFDSEHSLVYYPMRPIKDDTLNMNYLSIDQRWYISKEHNNTDYQ